MEWSCQKLKWSDQGIHRLGEGVGVIKFLWILSLTYLLGSEVDMSNKQAGI